MALCDPKKANMKVAFFLQPRSVAETVFTHNAPKCNKIHPVITEMLSFAVINIVTSFSGVEYNHVDWGGV